MLDEKQEQLEKRALEIDARESAAEEMRERHEQLIAEEQRKLERVAGMSAEKAKRELMRRLEEAKAAGAETYATAELQRLPLR